LGQNSWFAEEKSRPLVAPPSPAFDSAGHEEQQAFESKIKTEIKKLLSKKSLGNLTRALADVQSNKDQKALQIGSEGNIREEMDLPDVDEVIRKIWVPANPLDMIDTLHKATSKCLQTLRERGEDISETHKVWQAATRILGYMAICLVSREWLDSHRAQSNPYHDIPLEKLAGIEIVSARLEEIPACLTLSGAEIHGTNWIFIREGDIKSPETFVPEQGWQVKQTCEQIEVMVYRAVLNEKKEKLTHVDRDDLNETLKIYREDPDDTKNYYLSVHKTSRSHPLRDQEICTSLNQRLHELPIIHFGAREGQQPLLVAEGVLAARIRHFLKLIHNEP
jgi:hypothetical protein